MMMQLKIKVLDITYIVILVSFFMGFFEIVFISAVVILIHELGHALVASFFNKKNINILVYPFGGLTKYDSLLNSSIKEEFLILISGPIIQLLFILLIFFFYQYNLVNSITYNIFLNVNKYLLFLNLLPILPLDGGRLLNLFFNLFLPFKLSHKVSIYISLFTLLVSASYIYLFNLEIIYIIVLFLISKDLIKEIKNHKILFNTFIYERKKHNFNYKKTKVVKSTKEFYRNKSHKVLLNKKLLDEEEYLQIVK